MGRREDRMAKLTAILSVSRALTPILNSINVVGRRYPLLSAVESEGAWAMRAFRCGTGPILTL